MRNLTLFSLLLISSAVILGLTAPITYVQASTNSAEQSISQSQSNEQSSQVSSGEYSVGSGNNVNVQNQENSGSNVLSQSLR